MYRAHPPQLYPKCLDLSLPACFLGQTAMRNKQQQHNHQRYYEDYDQWKMSDCSDILFGGDTVLTISTTPELDHLLNHYQVYKSFIIGEFLTKK